MSQAWSHVFLNVRHNAKHVDVVISGPARRQENKIFMFLKVHEKNRAMGTSTI